MNAAVFLDRDNTIIHNDSDLGDPAQVRLIQGAASAIASLKGLGYRIIVVSNQGGVARGLFAEADVDAVHERINELVRANTGIGIDRFYYCPYHPEGTEEKYRRDHPWRKPRPGMLLQAAKDLGLDLRQSWMIGDSSRDVQAGFSAGVIPILLSEKPELAPSPMPAAPPGTDERDTNPKRVMIEPVRDYFVVRSLVEAVRLVGQQRRPENVTKAMQTQREVVVPRIAPRLSGASFRTEEVDQAIAPLRLIEPDAAEETDTAIEDVATEIDQAAVEAEFTEATVEDDALNDDEHDVTATESEAPAQRLEKDFEEEMAAVVGDEETQEDAAEEEPSAPAPIQEQKTEPKQKPIAAETKGEPAQTEPAPLVPRASEDKPAASSKPSEKRRKARKSKKKTEEPKTVAAEPAAPVPPQAAKPAEPAAAPMPVAPAPPVALPLSRQTSPAPAATPARSISPAAAAASEPASSDKNDLSELPVDQTLRQILQELRNQRHMQSDFSFAAVLAIITQMVAIVCLVAGLLMGAGNTETFLRWIGCAVVLELMTIATLLFRR